MKQENVITVIQKGNKLRFIMVNDNEFAKKWCNISNELLKKGENKWVATTLDKDEVIGDINNKNEISIIFEGNIPISVYINQQNKAENSLAELLKDDNTYKIQKISYYIEVK